MGDIGADFPGAAKSDQCVEICAVQVNLAAMPVDDVADFPESFFEYAVRGWIGDH